jgi:hypothetical protein
MLSSITNSPLLETIICLILVYALLSLLVGTITEMINNWKNERGRMLFEGIVRMFANGADVNFGELLYKHPMVAAIFKTADRPPMYISNFMFSQALIDTIVNHGRKFIRDEDTFKLFQAGVNNMKGDGDLKIMLINMIEKSVSYSGGYPGKVLTMLDQQIQQWYKDQTDRMTGWFKDLMRRRVLLISIFVTLVLNVNSIHLFKTIYTSPTLRSQLTPIAEQIADNYSRSKQDTAISALQQTYKAVAMSHLQKGNADSAFGVLNKAVTTLDSLQRHHDSVGVNDLQQISDQLGELAALHIPIGWHKGVPPLSIDTATIDTATKDSVHVRGGKWVKKGSGRGIQLLWYVIGLAITVFSISAGAPFWFDMLLKLVNVRRAGKKPE